MCSFYRGLQLRPCDVHVGFERRYPAIGPVFHQLSRFLRAGQVGHLDEIAVGAFQIGAGYIHVWARQLSCLNVALQIQVGIGLHTPGCAHCGHTSGQVQARSGKCHLWYQQRWMGLPLAVQVRACDVEEMIVHPHNARYHRVSSKVKNGGVLRRRNVDAFLDYRDLSALDDYVLIFHRCRARAINYPHMRQHDLGCIHPHDLSYTLGKFWSLRGRWQQKEKRRENSCNDMSQKYASWESRYSIRLVRSAMRPREAR